MDITVLKLKKDPMVAELAAAVGYKFNTRKEKDPNTVMKAIVEMVADPEVLSDEKWETLSEAPQAY